MQKTLTFMTLGVALAVTAGCASRGGNNVNTGTPDEFRVVTKAPLSIPPEYGLRPPQAGASLPAEVTTDQSQAVAAFGQGLGADASASERALVAKAGANAVNPVIRGQLDYEEVKTIRRSPNLTDRVLFWRGTEEELAQAAEDNATGGEAVTVERKSGGNRIKLPGT